MSAMTSQSIASSPAAASSIIMLPNGSSSGTGGGRGLVGPDIMSGKCALLNRYEVDQCQTNNNSNNRDSFRGTPRSRRKVESNPRDDIAICRTNGRCCGSIQDLLESFHTAFSDDQIWAIIFQFMNLYRNAIIHNGGRGGSISPQATSGGMMSTTASTPRRKSKSGTGSTVANLLQKQSKKCIQNIAQSGSPKLNGSHCGGGVSSGGGSSGSDSESPSDLEGSDNSDIRRRSQNNNNLIRSGETTGGGAVVIENRCGNTSDEYTDDGEDNNSDKRSSRLDHMDYLNVPTSLQNFHIHKDGSVHVSYSNEGEITWARINIAITISADG